MPPFAYYISSDPPPEPPPPEETTRRLGLKLVKCVNSRTSSKKIKEEKKESLEEMKKRHRKERKEMKKRHAREKRAKWGAFRNAKEQFEYHHKALVRTIVKIGKHDLQNLTRQIQAKLPLEVRRMIYQLCWDENAVSWAQDILRFTQIESIDDARPIEVRRRYSSPCMWNSLSLPEILDEDDLKSGILWQLKTPDRDHLEGLRRMDSLLLPMSATSEDREREEFSAWNCIGPWITSEPIIDCMARQEIIEAFYEVNPCTFYVEVPHLKAFLDDDPFTPRHKETHKGFSCAQGLTSIAVPLNPPHSQPYSIESLDIGTNGDFEPLLSLKRRTCFTLRFVLFQELHLYEPGFTKLWKVKALLDKFRKVFNHVECVYVCGCWHMRTSETEECDQCRGEIHDCTSKSFVVDGVLEAPVEEWDGRLRAKTFCTECTPILDDERTTVGWMI